MPAVVKLHVRRVHALEREMLVVGRLCIPGEELSLRGVGRDLDESLGHGMGIAYGRGQAAAGVFDDLGHAAYIGDDRRQADGHSLQKRHGKPFRGGRHAIDVGCGEEARDVEALSPEGDAIFNSKLPNECFQMRPFGSIADDPELEIRNARCGEGHGADQRGEIFDGSEAADEQQGEAGLLRPVFRGRRLDGIDPVVDAHDTLPKRARRMTQVLAGHVADAYDPVAKAGYEVDCDLFAGGVRRCDEAVTGNDDGAGSCETRGNGGLQRRCRVVAVHHLGTHAAKFAEEAEKGSRQGSFAEDAYRNSVAKKLLAKSAKVAVGEDRDIMSVLPLKAAELGDKNLCSAHFKTVDDVNNFHARQRPDPGFVQDSKWLSNFHDTSRCANSLCVEDDILMRLPVRFRRSHRKRSFLEGEVRYE